MVGLTAQRHRSQLTELQRPWRKATGKRKGGKEHAHLDACVSAVRSDSYRWRSRDGAISPILRSRDRDFTAIRSLQRVSAVQACDCGQVLQGLYEGQAVWGYVY